MQWIYEQALERAATFGIEGVTYQLTMGVVKNIIPAIASTNALVSAACVNEALKLATYCNNSVKGCMMYMGQTGVSGHTFEYDRIDSCLICSKKKIEVEWEKEKTLAELIEHLKEKYKFMNPSISSESG